MSDDENVVAEVAVAETATPETKKANTRLSTAKLLKSKIANERFAGFVRKMAEQLRSKLKKEDSDYSAQTRLTSKIVKGILGSGENCHEPYKEQLKAAATDLYFVNEKTGQKGRTTEELEKLFDTLKDDFAGGNGGSAELPTNPEDLGLF